MKYVYIFLFLFIGCNNLYNYQPFERGMFVRDTRNRNCVGVVRFVLGEYVFVMFNCIDYHFNKEYIKNQWTLKTKLEKI